jgi:AcrR family transcriptional regulator
METPPRTRDRTATLDRTRQAILDAAAAVLSANPAATMADIADSVGMARSTVYRHFSDRSALQTAMQDYANAKLAEIGQQLSKRTGTAGEILLVLCQAYFDQADLLMSAYGDRTQSEEMEAAAGDGDLTALILKGHADGSIDPGLPPSWVEQALWALLYNAWLLTTSRTMTRHEALDLFLRSFGKLIAPRTLEPRREGASS